VVFSVDVSLIALAVPLIGGVATVSGPVVGAVLYVGVGELLEIFAPSLHMAAVGLMLLLVVLFMPNGLAPFLMGRWRRPSVPVQAAVTAERRP
jgi:branched-chain amino acid transport system permease protein